MLREDRAAKCRVMASPKSKNAPVPKGRPRGRRDDGLERSYSMGPLDATRSRHASLYAAAQCGALCCAAHRHAGPAKLPWLPHEAAPQAPAASTSTRLRERTGRDAEARSAPDARASAPDACAAARLPHAKRDHATLSKAPLAKLRAHRKRLSWGQTPISVPAKAGKKSGSDPEFCHRILSARRVLEGVFPEFALARLIDRQQANAVRELAPALERGRRGTHQHLAGGGVEGHVL